MIKHKHKLGSRKLQKSLPKDKKSIIYGSIIATFIAISPYLFYLHESVPSEKVWDTFLFTYNSGFYQDANISMWIFIGKALPLAFLIIWFFTCRHWWYHSLLVPIAMYIYQIIAHFNNDTEFIDEFQLIYMVPIMAIVIPSIYLIRAQMFDKINNVDKTMEELEEEFMVKPKGVWGKIRKYF